MVYICSRTVSGYSMEKSNQFEIDDFINQLLSSQKFDELADIVAEKAVKKIRNLETLEHVSEKPIARQSTEVSHSVEAEETNHDNNKNNDSHEDQDERKIVINADSKERNESPPLRQEISNKHNKLEDVDYRERERGEKPSQKVVKPTLNAQALMKKDDSPPPELSLKFKHLMKHVQNEKVRNRQDSHSNEHNPWKHLEYSKQKRSRPMPGIKNQDFKPVSSGRNVKFENKNVHTRYYDRRENLVNKQLSDPRCRSNQATCNSRPQFKAENRHRLPVIDIDENGKPKVKEEMKEVLQEQKNIKVETDKHKEMPRQDEDDEFTWKARNSDSGKSEDEHEDSKEQFLGSSTARSEPGEVTTRRAIRREGDRYYTYLSGAEYEEFYEKLGKQQKKKGVSAISLM